MKMLYFTFAILCLAGSIQAQAVTVACGDNDKCNDGLVCDDNKCRNKIAAACVNKAGCPTNADCSGDKKCTCDANYAPKADNSKCLKKLGQGCGADDECLSEKCTGQLCVCPANTTPDSTQSCKKFIGQSCKAKAECIIGDCTNELCTCPDKTTPVFAMTGCKKAPGQSCSENDDCGTNAECKAGTNTCTCKATFFSQNNQRCGKKAGEACRASTDCVPNASCANLKCACATNYSPDGDNFCSGASAVMASMVLLLASLLTPRWM